MDGADGDPADVAGGVVKFLVAAATVVAGASLNAWSVVPSSAASGATPANDGRGAATFEKSRLEMKLSEGTLSLVQ